MTVRSLSLLLFLFFFFLSFVPFGRIVSFSFSSYLPSPPTLIVLDFILFYFVSFHPFPCDFYLIYSDRPFPLVPEGQSSPWVVGTLGIHSATHQASPIAQ